MLTQTDREFEILPPLLSRQKSDLTDFVEPENSSRRSPTLQTSFRGMYGYSEGSEDIHHLVRPDFESRRNPQANSSKLYRWIAPLCFDFLILFLTIFRSCSLRRKAGSTGSSPTGLRKIVNKHILYFAVITIVNGLNVGFYACTSILPSLSICSLIARECSNSRGSSFEEYQCSSNDRLDLDHGFPISPLALLPILFISHLELRFLSSRYRFSSTFVRSRKCVQQCSKFKPTSPNAVPNELPRVARPSRRLLASTKPSRNDRETFAQKDPLFNNHPDVFFPRKETFLPLFFFFLFKLFNLSSFLRTHHNPHHPRPFTPSFRDPSLLLGTPTFTPLIILHQTSLSPLEPLNHFPSPSSSSSQPSSSSEPNSFPIFSSNHDSRNRTFNSPNLLRIIL